MPSSQPPSTATSGRLQEIDFLRAYAVLFVIILHIVGAWRADHPNLIHFFANADLGTGVDIFFAISGFVIAKALGPFWEAGKPETRRAFLQQTLLFYHKRFVRLWPAAALWLTLCLAGSFVFHGLPEWPSRTESVQTFLSGLVYLYNFHGYTTWTIFGFFWSLSVEWQFYLFLPLLLVTVPRDRFRALILIAFLVGSDFFRPGGTGWWMFRFDGIVYGVLAYMVLNRWQIGVPHYKSLETRLGSAFFTFAFLAIIVILPVALEPKRFGLSLSSFLAALLVAAASTNRGYISTFGLKKIVGWIGSRSYSLYLVNIPSMLIVKSVLEGHVGHALVEHPTPELQALIYGCIFALLLAATEATYRFVEAPSHKASRALGQLKPPEVNSAARAPGCPLST